MIDDAEWTAATRELTRRFREAPVNLREYARWKVRLDPMYCRVASRVAGSRTLVDLGAGLGILSMLLVITGRAERAIGFDWDEAKVNAGARAAEGLAVRLSTGDVRAIEPPACDVIALLDVLHYFDDETQRSVLDRAARALSPGGLLIIRDADGARASGGLTRLLERAAMKLGWNRSERAPAFRPLARIAADLTSLGFEVESEDAAGPLHPGNALLVATKR